MNRLASLVKIDHYETYSMSGKIVVLLFLATLFSGCTIYQRSKFVVDWEGKTIEQLISIMGPPNVVRSDHYLGKVLTYRVNRPAKGVDAPRVTFFIFWADRYNRIYKWRVE